MEKPGRYEAKDRRRKNDPFTHLNPLILSVILQYTEEMKECTGGLREIVRYAPRETGALTEDLEFGISGR